MPGKPPQSKNPGSKKQGSGSLSDEDRALWEKVAGSAEPLRDRPTRPEGLTPEVKAPAAKPGSPKAVQARKPTGPLPLIETPRRKAEAPELSHGTVSGMDRRQAVRLRRGRLPIDARLDLHGDTQAEAHRRLNAFLAEAQVSGKRCVLVVTGRGVGKAEGGVLRAQVPRWLNQPPNRNRVLAFDIAQPKDGGDGALYVLLRRERGERRP